jgi:acetyltransferase-like isoleucine patch superfamily enzyme
MRDSIYSFLESLLGKLKKRPYRLDRRIPLASFAGLSLRRAVWMLRGIATTAFWQWRPKAIFIASGVQLRNISGIRFGRGVTLERGVIIDGLAEHGVVLNDDVSIGAYSLIRCSTAANVGAGIAFGANSSCDAYSFFGAGGFVSIGRNVIMGQHVAFHAEAHNFERTDIPIRAQGVTMKPITIEDDCWIGANATFLGGAYVAKGSIVGAGAVVNKTFPAFSIIAGVPAKIIKMREAVPQESTP